MEVSSRLPRWAPNAITYHHPFDREVEGGLTTDPAKEQCDQRSRVQSDTTTGNASNLTKPKRQEREAPLEPLGGS